MTGLPETERDWAPFLYPDERVLWIGKPAEIPPLMARDVPHVLFGLDPRVIFGTITFLVSIASAMGLTTVAGMSDTPSYFFFPLGLFGFWLGILSPLLSYLSYRNTRYALTNLRALAYTRALIKRLSYISLNDRTPVEITYGRRGTIWMGAWPQPDAPSGIIGLLKPREEPYSILFTGLNAAKEVSSLVQRIRRDEA